MDLFLKKRLYQVGAACSVCITTKTKQNGKNKKWNNNNINGTNSVKMVLTVYEKIDIWCLVEILYSFSIDRIKE